MAVDIGLDLYRSVGNSRLESGANPDNVFADGLIYTITGTGFGTRTGYADHIRNTSILQLPDDSNFGAVGRWSGSSYVGAGERFKVVSEGIDGGKCLRAYIDAGTAHNATLLFNYDAPVALGNKVFTSVWVKHRVTGSVSPGQWKFGRWQKSTNSLSDKASECYWNSNIGAPDHKIQVRDYRGVGGFSADITVHTGDYTRAAGSFDWLPHGRDKWVRMDILHTLATSYDAAGQYKCSAWLHDPDGLLPPVFCDFTDNGPTDAVNPYGQAGDEWMQHLYQNYFGNGDYGSATHDLWLSDCYESVGDFKLVEIANHADLTLATRRFIVPEISWADTQIQVRGFTGGMTGAKWLHTVVNGVSTSVRAV